MHLRDSDCFLLLNVKVNKNKLNIFGPYNQKRWKILDYIEFHFNI
jgi:hypothetical protein